MPVFKKQEVDHEREVIRLYLGKPNRLDDFEVTDILFPRSHEAGKRHWEKYREAVLAEWVAEHPGTRPWAEWKYSLPELSRQRLGGSGTPMLPPDGEWKANGGHAAFGIPLYWHRDVNPADPPVFEAQAAFLHRHGLLADEEQAVLRLSPVTFTPLTIGPEWYLTREYLPFYEQDFAELPPCLR